MFPPPLGSSRLAPAPPGLPGSSADLSSRAVSNHPGRPDGCSHPLLHRRWQASPLSGGLATFIFVTRPNRVRLRYGSRLRPGKASPAGLLRPALAGLLVERVIYKVNSSQFTRSARLVLALQSYKTTLRYHSCQDFKIVVVQWAARRKQIAGDEEISVGEHQAPQPRHPTSLQAAELQDNSALPLVPGFQNRGRSMGGASEADCR